MAKTEEKKPTTAVAVPPAGTLAAPDFIDDSDYGSGFEGADKSAYAIPFLQILQKMSPLVDEDDPKHVEGAKAGMIYNTVTQKLYDGKSGLLLIPCAFKRSYIQWGGREGEGGFKGEFTPEEFDKKVESGVITVLDGRPLLKDDKGDVHPKKSDYFADTRSHYVIWIDPETKESGQAILSLSSTQIQASKKLMTALQQVKVTAAGGVKKTPPMFANVVKFTTIGQSNDKGSWSGARFDMDGLVQDRELFDLAKEFHKAVSAGDVNVDRTRDPSSTDTGEVSGDAQKADSF